MLSPEAIGYHYRKTFQPQYQHFHRPLRTAMPIYLLNVVYDWSFFSPRFTQHGRRVAGHNHGTDPLGTGRISRIPTAPIPVPQNNGGPARPAPSPSLIYQTNI